MNPGGVVLVAFGALALAQLFGGRLLERLNIVPSKSGNGLAPGETLLGQAPQGTTLPDLAPGQTMPRFPNPDAPTYNPPAITGASAPLQPSGLTLVG